MQARLKEFMDSERLNARELSERIGVQASSVSHILTGRNKPSIDFLVKILEAFPYMDLTYLISGIKQVDPTIINTENPVVEKREISIEKELVEVEKGHLVTNVTSENKIREIIVFYENGTFDQYLQKVR